MLYFSQIHVSVQLYTVNCTDDNSVAVHSPTESHFNNSSLIRKISAKQGQFVQGEKMGLFLKYNLTMSTTFQKVLWVQPWQLQRE